ncbi:MAG: DUF5603 domain-containing protein [Zestosphaera sp.]
MSSEEKVRVRIPKYDIPVLRVKYLLLDVDLLLPHEEIVTERLNDIARKIEELRALDMPIVVAPIPGSTKYLIVDGHHRWAALKKLGCRKIPSVVIDYFDPRVRVYTWYPAFSGSSEPLISELRRSGLTISDCDLKIYSLSDEDLIGKAFVILSKLEECMYVEGDVEAQRRVLRVLDVLAVKNLIKLVWYGLVSDAAEDLAKGEIDYILLRKPYTKAEVISYVREGNVYPPKTTRHVLPFIPAKDYVKLELMCV